MTENKKSRRKEPIMVTIFFGLIWIAAVIEFVIICTTINAYCFQEIGIVYLVFAGSLTLTPILLLNLWKS